MNARSLSFLLLAIGALSTGCSETSGDPGDDSVYRGEDLCLSPTDREILSWRTLDAGLPDAAVLDISEVAKSCVRGPCLSAAIEGTGVETCMQTCLGESAIGEASPGCRGCFIDTVACAQDNCVIECLGSDHDACDACLREHCVEGLDLCTGLPSPA